MISCLLHHPLSSPSRRVAAEVFAGGAMAGLPELLQALKVALLLALMPAAMASSLSSFWQRRLPRTAMPEAFKELESPLSTALVQHYNWQLQAGSMQASKNEEFCSSAGIYCQGAATIVGPQPRVCIPPFFLYAYNVLPCNRGGSGAGDGAGLSAAQPSGGIFFSRDSLAVGKSVQLPNTANSLRGLKFLPHAIASALPEISASSLRDLTGFYGVTEGSDMELDMQNTAAHCGSASEHEAKACLISGEAMVSFVSETVGCNVVAIAPPEIAAQEASVLDIKVLNMKDSRVASCHDMKFPSLLFSCHTTRSSRVMDVALKLANRKIVHMPAVCHLDTSYWNPSHVAFQVLNAKPGVSSICHWFPQNSFIFVERSS